MDKLALIEYMSDGVKKGYSLDFIKNHLVKHGNDANVVNEVAKAVQHKPKKRRLWIIPAALVIIGIIAAAILYNNTVLQETGQQAGEQADKISEMIIELSDKQRAIDENIERLETLNLSVQEKEEIIKEQAILIKDINMQTKQQFLQIRDFLLELNNNMLKRISE